MLLSRFAQHLHLISPLKRLLGHFGSLYWSIYLVKFDHSGIAFDHWMNYKKYDFFLFHILWWFFFLWWFKQPENSNIRTNLLLRIPDVWDSPVVAFTILHQTGTKCLLIFQPKSQNFPLSIYRPFPEMESYLAIISVRPVMLQISPHSRGCGHELTP